MSAFFSDLYALPKMLRDLQNQLTLQGNLIMAKIKSESLRQLLAEQSAK